MVDAEAYLTCDSRVSVRDGLREIKWTSHKEHDMGMTSDPPYMCIHVHLHPDT